MDNRIVKQRHLENKKLRHDNAIYRVFSDHVGSFLFRNTLPVRYIAAATDINCTGIDTVTLALQLPRRSAQESTQLDVVTGNHVLVSRLRRHCSKHVLRPRHCRLHRRHCAFARSYLLIHSHAVLHTRIKGGPKMHAFSYAFTSSNIDRFSNSFRCQNQENICNNTTIKIPPRLKCGVTLPCEMSVSYRQQLKTRRLLQGATENARPDIARPLKLWRLTSRDWSTRHHIARVDIARLVSLCEYRSSIQVNICGREYYMSCGCMCVVLLNSV